MPLCFHFLFTDGRQVASLYHSATLWHLFTVLPCLSFLYFSLFFFSRKLHLKRSIMCIEIPTAFVAADHLSIYTVSQEECARLRESVPYVKVYRYNPKHLYPKLNGYGDNGQRKVWSSCGSTYCTCPADAVSWAGTVRVQSTARTLSSVM